MDVTITNYWTGDLVETRTVDLNGQVWANEFMNFAFPHQPVNVRIDVQLDANEQFYLDAVTFVPR